MTTVRLCGTGTSERQRRRGGWYSRARSESRRLPQCIYEDILLRLLFDAFFFFAWVIAGVWMYKQARTRVDDLLQGTIAIQERITNPHPYHDPILR